ncbi:hypothetical protein AcidC75_11360 [Acidisoma sp. C75]
MVYNEPYYLPIWCRHYGAAVGPENCYIIDHGSDDGSTERLGGVNLTRLPRSPLDEDWRAQLVSDYCADLLGRYDAVIYADVDELLVADPRHHASLADCAAAMQGPVRTAIGFDVWHIASEQPPIDLSRPISEQRQWLWFNSAMCKPSLIRAPVKWAPGFHSAGVPVDFRHLYLFHLHYFDTELGIRRLGKTRATDWPNDHVNLHQRRSDEEWLQMSRDVAKLPRAQGADFDNDPLLHLVLKTVLSQRGREHDQYRIDLTINSQSLIPLPARFKGLF